MDYLYLKVGERRRLIQSLFTHLLSLKALFTNQILEIKNLEITKQNSQKIASWTP